MNVYQRTALSALFCLVLGLSVAACGKKAPPVSMPHPTRPLACTPSRQHRRDTGGGDHRDG